MNVLTSNKVQIVTVVSGIQNVKRFSYRELRNATQDFSPANKIGEGGFGSVYKVIGECLILSMYF